MYDVIFVRLKQDLLNILCIQYSMYAVIFVWLMQNKILNMKQTALCMTSCLLLLFLQPTFIYSYY